MKGKQNPTKDGDLELSILLSRLFQAFINAYPKEVQQKALPLIVLNKLAKHQVTEMDVVLAQLGIGPAFFAWHSCE